MTLNELASRLHKTAVAHGFYANGTAYADRLACIHEEVSKLWHAHRKGKLADLCGKDHLPLTCEAEELADIVIRVLDLAAARGVDMDRAVLLKSEYNDRRDFLHGDAHAPGTANV